MRPNPAAPINLVEEPVHDHQQNYDGEQSGRRLEIERRHIVAKRPDNADRNQPGNQGRGESDSGAETNGAAVRLPRAGHTRGDGGEDQNAFEAFAENEHADIEERNRGAGVGPHRIGHALFGEALPNQDCHDGGGGDTEAGRKKYRTASRHSIHDPSYHRTIWLAAGWLAFF